MKGKSCREHTPIYTDAVVCCRTCMFWNGVKCDEKEKARAARERELREWDREMRSNRAVFLE
jgi:hypothetical protein